MVTQPLDLYQIFVEYFAGSMEIFMFVALIVLTYLAARMRMPNIVLGFMVGIFILLMGFWYLPTYILGVVVIGLIIGMLLRKTTQ